jgi:hypothetical protein
MKNPFDSAGEKNFNAIAIDSAASVSFILEHTMNKWAGNGFNQDPSRQSLQRSGA